MNILPQIAQRTQRNAASCIISQRKTVWVGVVIVVIGALGFVVRLRHLRDLRETLGFPLC